MDRDIITTINRLQSGERLPNANNYLRTISRNNIEEMTMLLEKAGELLSQAVGEQHLMQIFSEYFKLHMQNLVYNKIENMDVPVGYYVSVEAKNFKDLSKVAVSSDKFQMITTENSIELNITDEYLTQIKSVAKSVKY